MKWFIYTLFIAFICFNTLHAQEIKKQTPDVSQLMDMENKKEKLSVTLNMQSRLNFHFNKDFQKAEFDMKDLRIAADGKINDHFFYAYQHRLYRSNHAGSNVDNLPASIDIAGIGIALRDDVEVFLGKQCAAYGGMEFDTYPHQVYEFSDMGDFITCYMTGAKLVWKINKENELQIQALNSLIKPFEDTYGKIPEVMPAKMPFVYSLNWNAHTFAGNKEISVRWSASLMQEAKDKNMYYVALGNRLKTNRWDIYLDALYSREDIDRKGVITQIINQGKEYSALNASYLSFILKANYMFADKWAVFTKGMYETASVFKAQPNIETGKYYTSWGYLAGVEFYPIKNSDLHFFANYTARSYLYTNKAVNFSDADKHRISLGFIYSLPVF